MIVYRFIKKWALTIVALSVFFWLTLAPHPLPDSDVKWFYGADKVVHALMLWGITCAVIFDRRRARCVESWRSRLVIFIAMAVLSALDEAAQTAMGLGRTGDAFDLLADGVGIAVGLCTAAPIIKFIFRGRL